MSDTDAPSPWDGFSRLRRGCDGTDSTDSTDNTMERQHSLFNVLSWFRIQFSDKTKTEDEN